MNNSHIFVRFAIRSFLNTESALVKVANNLLLANYTSLYSF